MTLCIIQARLGSTRFPNKVMQTVGGIPMVKRVWLAAKGCAFIDKVIVAWPERYPDLNENNVLERFRRIVDEFKPDIIIRLTADCPLITSEDIYDALENFEGWYYNNKKDGKDVQIFPSETLKDDGYTHSEHVISAIPNLQSKLGYRSVNTKEDLEYVRNLLKKGY